MPAAMDVPMGHKRVKVSWYKGNICSSAGLLAFSVESYTLHPKQCGHCHCHEILWMFLDYLHVTVAQHFPSRCQFFFLFQKKCLLWNFCDLYFLKCLTQMIKKSAHWRFCYYWKVHFTSCDQKHLKAANYGLLGDVQPFWQVRKCTSAYEIMRLKSHRN